MQSVIKLSSAATHEFWEIPVLYEDEHLLILNKPDGLLTSPDRCGGLDRPDLMALLHAGIAAAKPWAAERRLTYLMNAHRLDFDSSGVLLLARTKPVLITLASFFGSEKPNLQYVALSHGSPRENHFEVSAGLGPHPVQTGLMRVDFESGKRSLTNFEVLERFSRWTLLKCEPLTNRTHQIRVHLRHVGLPMVGDNLYGGRPLLLSQLKTVYRLKPGQSENPLIARPALHAESLTLPHPVTGQVFTITAPWPKDLTVAIKYLRKHASAFQGDPPMS